MRLAFVTRLAIAVLVIPSVFFAQEEEEHGPRPFPHYRVIDLGTLGGAYSYVYGISNRGEAAGGAATKNQTNGVSQVAFRWYRGHIKSLGTLGGPDSEADSPNASGEIPVLSETANQDPNHEDFCEFGTHLQCRAAIWKDGALFALPKLAGGNNSQAYFVNDAGQVVGIAENGVPDSTCKTSVPNQLFRFEAVLWEPNGAVKELQPLPDDTVGFAFGINNRGEVVGGSGVCSNTAFPPNLQPAAPHAVLWKRDGTPIDLGGLGGSYNLATAINNRGDVVGNSQSSTDGNIHAFLWTRHTGIHDLGTLPGDFMSVAPCCGSINDRGQVIGFSIPGPNGNGRAFLWQDGEMKDLNDLIPKDSPWYLLSATSMNNAGEIVGFGTINGETHAFLAVPCGRGDDDAASEEAQAIIGKGATTGPVRPVARPGRLSPMR